MKWIVDPRGKKTEFGYDNFGDLRKVTDPLGTTTPDPNDHVTQFEYDPMGRRTAVIDQLAHRTETQYDVRGRVRVERRFDALRQLELDQRGRPVRTHFADRAVGKTLDAHALGRAGEPRRVAGLRAHHLDRQDGPAGKQPSPAA